VAEGRLDFYIRQYFRFVLGVVAFVVDGVVVVERTSRVSRWNGASKDE
jgi:uncharacterized membrane protein